MNFTLNQRHFSIIYGAIVLICLLLAYFLFLLKPVSLSDGGLEQSFIVEHGENFFSVSAKLRDAGLIRSKAAFRIYSIFSLAALNFKAGDYVLSPAISTPKIIAKLFRGPGADIEVTIIEGSNLKEIDRKLRDSGVILSGAIESLKSEYFQEDFEFLRDAKSLEGFLFPDTYRFYKDSPAENIARRFLENFNKKARPMIIQNELSSYELLILGSLIEKEVPFHADRLMVSGILRKRLAIGMALQVDSAPETYQSQGLPREPITNPGLDAIFAAANPRSSPYLYYLSDPKTKKTIFAENFEQHKENKWLYLKK